MRHEGLAALEEIVGSGEATSSSGGENLIEFAFSKDCRLSFVLFDLGYRVLELFTLGLSAKLHNLLIIQLLT